MTSKDVKTRIGRKPKRVDDLREVLHRDGRSELAYQMQNLNSVIQRQALEIEGLKLEVQLKESRISKLNRSSDAFEELKLQKEFISLKNQKIDDLEKALDKEKKKVSDLKLKRSFDHVIHKLKKPVGKVLDEAILKEQKAEIKDMKKVIQVQEDKEKLYQKRILRLERSVQEKANVIENLESDLEAVKDELEKKNEILAENTKKIKVDENQLNAKKEELALKEAEISNKNAEILQLKDDTRKEIADLENRLVASENELNVQKEELAVKVAEISDKNAEILQVKDTSKKFAELEKQLVDKTKDLQDMSKELEKARESHKGLETRPTVLKKESKSFLTNVDKNKNKKENTVPATQDLSHAAKSSTKKVSKRVNIDNSDQTDVKKAKCAKKVSDNANNNKEKAKSIPVDESKTLAEFCEKVKMEIKTSGCIKELPKCSRRSCDDCKQVIRSLFIRKSRELLELKVRNPAEAIRALRTQAFLNVTGYFPDSF